MKVCRYDDGNTTVFTCPYHGWSYGTDGALAGVPFFREAYHSELDRAKWGLVEVAQMYCYKGTVWANWDASAPPFLEYLGEFRRFLDLILDGWDGREGQAELIGGVQKWIIPCNWKFPAENFSGDTYHNISHRSVDLVGAGPSGRSRRDYSELNVARKLHVAIPDRGTPDDHLRASQGSPATGGVSELARGCEVFPPLRGGAAASTGRQQPVDRRARRDFSQCGACYPGSRARWRCGTRRAHMRPRYGGSSLSIAMRRNRSRISCAITTFVTPGRRG